MRVAVVSAVCAAADGAVVAAAAVRAAVVGVVCAAADAAPSALPPFRKGWIGLMTDQTAPLCSAAAAW